MSESAPYTETDSVIDLRDRLRPVGDQGRRGTCVAFAVTSVHEAGRGPCADTGLPEDLAEEVLFWGAKQIDGDTNDGTRFTSADQALQRWGQPAEGLWPYDDSRNQSDATYVPPAEAIAPANCRRTPLRPLTIDVQRLRMELAAGRPVALGIRVWDGFRHARTEPLPVPDPSELYPTGHAVVAVGHDRVRSAVLVRNSWGPHWGNDGHLWIDDGILSLARAAWSVDNQTAGEAAPEHDEVLT
jgi:C1A family cysteine protease